MDVHGCALVGNGSAALSNCDKLRVLDLSSNSLTVLPSNFPRGLSHLFLDSNPIHATATELTGIVNGAPNIAALDVAFLALSVNLENTRLTKPTDCRLGPEPPQCAFVLHLHDAQNRAVKVGRLQPNLTLGVRGVRALMEDLGVGRYKAVVPAAWRPNAIGSLRVNFFDGDGTEFTPKYDGNGATGKEPEFSMALRSVEYGAVACSAGSHMVPHPASGAICVCAPGYESDVADANSSIVASCHKVCGNNTIGAACDRCPVGFYYLAGACHRCPIYAICHGGVLEYAAAVPCPAGRQPDAAGERCDPCPPGQTNRGMAICTPCGANQVPTADATSCICTFGHYNSSKFDKQKLTCISQDFSKPAGRASAQCEPCGGNQACVVCDDDMKTLPGWQALGVATQWSILKCPLDDACLGEDRGCSDGYTGPLCAVCSTGYARMRNLCKLCTETGIEMAVIVVSILVCCPAAWIGSQLLSASRRSPAAVSTQLAGSGNPVHRSIQQYILEDVSQTKASQRQKMMAMARVVFQPGRIIIGFFQVIMQIGPVLHLDFPPWMEKVLDYMRPLAIDFQTILQIKCLGELGFDVVWIIKTLIVPTTVAGFILLWYFYERRKVDRGIAGERCRGNLFVLVFLIYPGISNRAFGVFNCRTLSVSVRVLVADYSVECDSDQHSVIRLLAAIVVVCFSCGVPVILMLMMFQRTREHNTTTDADRFVARRVAEELQLDDRVAVDAIRDVRMGKEYSFMVTAFQPRFFYWEGVDMLRKLAMVGLLVLCGQGSLSQIFIGLCISTTSLVAQTRLSPYKHWEDNHLKVATEVAIFLTLLVAMMLKATATEGTSTNELVSIASLDVLLVCVFVLGLPVAFIMTILRKRGQMRQALVPAPVNVPTEERRRAIRLFQLGIGSAAEVRVLADFIGKLDHMVNQATHIFISYRVSADAELARQLYEQLSLRTLEATGQRMKVYLDKVRLEDGQRWDTGFMGGLAKSMVFIPIVSVGALRGMTNLGARDDEAADYMLVEWAAALELQQRGTVNAVFPLIVAAADNFNAEANAAFGGVDALPDRVSKMTLDTVAFHLEEATGDGSTALLQRMVQEAGGGDAELTVRRLIKALLKFQGVQYSYSVGTQLDQCVVRAHQTVASCLQRAGPMDNSDVALDSGEL
jgi:hypothetical protein